MPDQLTLVRVGSRSGVVTSRDGTIVDGGPNWRGAAGKPLDTFLAGAMAHAFKHDLELTATDIEPTTD